MCTFEKVLVCVEDVNLDDHVIEYAHMIAKAVDLKKLYLLHVIHDIPLEENMRQSRIDGMASMNLDEQYQQEIERLTTGYQNAMTLAAKKHFQDIQHIEHQVEVRVGNQLRDTLQLAANEDIDLIIVGRHLGARLSMGDTALMARRITRKSSCSVLTVPENFAPKLSKILCPVRDSECSTMALQTAIDLGKALNAPVTAANIYHVFSEIHYPGGAPNPVIPYEVKQAAVEAKAQSENEHLNEKVDASGAVLQFKCYNDDAFVPGNKCEELVETDDFDLVVIGSRGRSGAAGVLLGSVTEQLIKQCKVPILATKKKGEHVGLLNAMLAIFGK